MNRRSCIVCQSRSPRLHTSPSGSRYTGLRALASGFAGVGLVLALGCQDSGLARIDRRVDELIALGDDSIGADSTVGSTARLGDARTDSGTMDNEYPGTTNPAAGEMTFNAATDAQREVDSVIARLEDYATPSGEPTTMALPELLRFAIDHAREYRFAEEEYVLAALRLLIEEHRWGPRFFDTFSTTASANGESGTYDSALSLVNEFSVTQRLPYGGTVSARALASAVEDLHQRVSGEPSQTATLIFDASIPLLRGAGMTAREDLIQSRRSLIYSARAFEEFRRDFLVSITIDYLDLVVSARNIENAHRQVASLEDLERREVSLYEEGRQRRFDAAIAQNATVRARDNLNSQQERYRLDLDRFKVRIGMPVDQTLIITDSALNVAAPSTALDEAVATAFRLRLDLQSERDQVDDTRRALRNAVNNALPDLTLTGSARVPTDDNRERQGLRFDGEDSDYTVGVTFGLPLDREIERAQIRQAQISLERAIREYERQRDTVAVAVRGAVRAIDAAFFSLDIQRRGIEIAQQRKDSIDADPAAATARDRSEAEDELLSAQDAWNRAYRDLQVALLNYLLETGQLRVGSDGRIAPLQGMPDPLDPNNAIQAP